MIYTRFNPRTAGTRTMPATSSKTLPVLTDVATVDLTRISAKQAVLMCIAIADDATHDDAGMVPGKHTQAHIIARAATERIVEAMKQRFGLS